MNNPSLATICVVQDGGQFYLFRDWSEEEPTAVVTYPAGDVLDLQRRAEHARDWFINRWCANCFLEPDFDRPDDMGSYTIALGKEYYATVRQDGRVSIRDMVSRQRMTIPVQSLEHLTDVIAAAHKRMSQS